LTNEFSLLQTIKSTTWHLLINGNLKSSTIDHFHSNLDPETKLKHTLKSNHLLLEITIKSPSPILTSKKDADYIRKWKNYSADNVKQQSSGFDLNILEKRAQEHVDCINMYHMNSLSDLLLKKK